MDGSHIPRNLIATHVPFLLLYKWKYLPCQDHLGSLKRSVVVTNETCIMTGHTCFHI